MQLNAGLAHHRLRHSCFAFILLTISIASACGGPSEDQPDETNQSAALEVEVSACSADVIAWPDPFATDKDCSGPWQYNRHIRPCYLEGTDAAKCGTVEVQESCYRCVHKEQTQTHIKTVDVTITCSLGPGGAQFCGSKTLAGACTQAGVNATRSVQGAGTNPSDPTKPNPEIPYTAQLVAGTAWNNTGSTTVVKHQSCRITLTNAKDSASFLCGSGTQTTCPKTVAKTCRHIDFGEAPLGECGSYPVASIQGGLSRSALAASDADADMSSAICTTREPMPIATIQNAQARNDAMAGLELQTAPMWSTLPAPEAVEAAARDTIVKHRKLLLELRWDGLTPAARASARALYGLFPDLEHGCGIPARPPISSTCVDWMQQQGFRAQLAICRRLLSSHVPLGFVKAEYPGCIALMTNSAWSTQEACSAEVQPYVEAMAEALAARMQQLADTSAADKVGTRAALSAMDAWHIGARTLMVNRGDDLTAASNRLVASFWNRAQETSFVLPATFPTGANGSSETRDQLASLFDAQLSASQHVLTAAFTSPPPIRSRVLLMIVSDSLQPLFGKLDQLVPYYDFACRIRGCSVAEANEATFLFRLIGTLANKAELDATLLSANAVRASWKAVFAKIAAEHATLVDAYRDATGRPNAELGEMLSAGVDPAVADLAALVGASNRRWNHYEASGLLEPHAVGRLLNGLEHDRRIVIANELDRLRSDLVTAVATFAAGRGAIANLVLQRIQSGALFSSVEAEIDSMNHELSQASDDLEALRRTHDIENITFGSFMEKFVANTQRPGWLPEYPVNAQASQLQVAANDALYSSNINPLTELPRIAVRSMPDRTHPWTMSVAAGDLLVMHVGGQWAPTCALRANGFTGPNGITGRDAMTGPEGYRMTWSIDHAEAHSYTNSSEDYTSTSHSATACAGAAGKAGFENDSGALGIGLQGSIQYCYNWTTGHRESDVTSDSTSDSERSSAGFAGGLRLPETPFSTMPAGALLLVEVVKTNDGQSERIRDINVVTPSSAFLFKDAADVYLVVNDFACGDSNTSPLSLSVVHAQASGPASKALAKSMASVLIDIDAKSQIYISQGSVTSAELEVMRGDALDELLVACNGCNLDSYPATLRGMFQTYVDHLLANVERRVRIADSQRDIVRFVRRLGALARDLALAEERSHAEQLFTYWELANLSGSYLAAQSKLVFEWVNDRVYPMMAIRYPSQFAGIRSAGAGVLNTLRQTDLMLPIETFAQRAENVASIVSSKLREGAAVSTNRTAPIVLAFEKPPVPGSTAEQDDLFGDGAEANEWNKAHASRRDMVWEPVKDATGKIVDYKLRDTAVFAIVPEDVYEAGKGGLLCVEAAPVIKAMAIFADTASDSRNLEWNNNARRRPALPAPTVYFTHEDDGMQFTMANPEWNGFGLRILAGRDEDITTAFNQFALGEQAALGLSPFGTFTVDFSPLLANPSQATPGPLLSTATAVYVVFQVETRGSTGPLAGVPQCQ